MTNGAVMHDFDLAYVAHRTPTRVRLRIPSRYNDAEFFGGLQRQLRASDGIVRVEENAVTASLVIVSRGGFDWSSLRLTDLGLAVAYGATLSSGAVGPLRITTTLKPANAALSSAAPNRLSEADLVAQLAPLIFARNPAVAFAQWTGETILKSLFRCLLTPKAQSA
jgi:hypothetical protein